MRRSDRGLSYGYIYRQLRDRRREGDGSRPAAVGGSTGGTVLALATFPVAGTTLAVVRLRPASMPDRAA